MRSFKRVLNGTSAAVLMLSSLISMGFTGVAHATGKSGLNLIICARNRTTCTGDFGKSGIEYATLQ